MKTAVLKLLALQPLLWAAAWAQAQLIDDVSLRGEGGDTVLQVRFTAPVQYQRAVLMPSGDFVQAFYEVLPPHDGLDLASGQRRVLGGDRLPRVTVTDESVERGGVARKLVVRFAEPQRARVRAGRGNRSIEFVLTAMAPRAVRAASAVLPSPAPATPQPPAPVAMPAPARASAPIATMTPPTTATTATPPQRYVVVIKAYESVVEPLEMPVPRSLQDYTVYTEKRVVGTRTFYEVHLGHFDNRAEAERAQRLLAGRFPQARVIDLNLPREPEPEPVVAAAAAVPPSAPAIAAPSPVPSAPAMAASASVPGDPAAATAAPVPSDLDRRAAELLAAARAAQAAGQLPDALATLGRLLDMPPNASSREAQALAAVLRAQSGDLARARTELELFLSRYPNGADADRLRAELARLPAEPRRSRVRAPVPPSTTLAGSISQFYYGGQSKVRTQEFQDSPISGLPELQTESSFSGTDQKQAVSSVDVNWRHRDAERDMRFVFRDSYTADLLASGRSRNRLSALYFDHRSSSLGTQVRIGRQSGTGGGVLGRFDGVQGGVHVAPKWRVNGVAGMPADKLLDSKRRFWGTSLDAEAITPELSGSLYLIEQTIDGEVDRRGLGSELRYFSGGVSAFGTVDYDQALRALNIAMLQGTWQTEANTVVNLLIDRRATPMLALGNALFFQTASPPAQSLRELLASGATVGDLRTRVRGLNSYTTQAVIGVTTPVSAKWQLGGDIRSTQIGEIAPVPELLPFGQKPTRVLALGTQLIGSNLHSLRDTHVLGLSWLKGSTQLVAVADPVDPANSTYRDSTYTAVLLNYNHSSLIRDALTLEPSIKFYRQSDNAGLRTTRWTPGLRLSWRLGQQFTAESELTSEFSKTSSPARNESSNRVYYYLGARYDF